MEKPATYVWKSDGRLLFTTRMLRLFAYGLISVVLVLYLKQIGLDERAIGALLTLTLIGDTAISLWITTQADRIGRRRMLLIGAGLMFLAGLVFALTRNGFLLLVAATIGVISPSGNEVGPFLSIEQATLSQTVPEARRTHIFAWYNLVGSIAMATGSLTAGVLTQTLHDVGLTRLASYRVVVGVYAVIGILLGLLFLRLSPAAEAPVRKEAADSPLTLANRFGLHRSRNIVLKLSGLFALDAFAGGLVMQSLMVYWFWVRFNLEPATLGGIFFGANLLAGVSALVASRLAARFGLVNTMVFTHIPSNLLLMLVPLMPNLPLAVAVLLLRFSLSQMDVPTRQSYTMAVVSPDERSAASGVTGVARTLGAALGPVVSGPLFKSAALFSVPFFLAGGLKIVYDLLLYHNLQRVPLRKDGPSAPKV